MSVFILVSGAWHGAWCWERVVPLLVARGHKVAAPDLVGMGADSTPLKNITLARWADQIADLVRQQSEPVILVGHSRGGIVISEAAERASERIAHLVYLTAFLLPDGATLMGAMGSRGDDSQNVLEAGPDNTTTLSQAAIGAAFYNATAQEWIARAKRMVGPEPMIVFSTPLRLTADGFGAAPRAYIECTQDRAVPLELQRSFQAKLHCAPVITLETDHSPFYSEPQQLADALIAIAESSGQ